MGIFKKGDRVRRVRLVAYHRGMQVGDEDVVKSVEEDGALTLRKYGDGHHAANFELVTSAYPNPPHKHAELIKAWADGAEVETDDGIGKWRVLPTGGSCPTFKPHHNYRMKPYNPNAEKIAALEATIDQAKRQLKELKNGNN